MTSLPSWTRPSMAAHFLPRGEPSTPALKISSMRRACSSVCCRCMVKASRRLVLLAALAILGNALINWFSALYRSFISLTNRSCIFSIVTYLHHNNPYTCLLAAPQQPLTAFHRGGHALALLVQHVLAALLHVVHPVQRLVPHFAHTIDGLIQLLFGLLTRLLGAVGHLVAQLQRLAPDLPAGALARLRRHQQHGQRPHQPADQQSGAEAGHSRAAVEVEPAIVALTVTHSFACLSGLPGKWTNA